MTNLISKLYLLDSVQLSKGSSLIIHNNNSIDLYSISRINTPVNCMVTYLKPIFWGPINTTHSLFNRTFM